MLSEEGAKKGISVCKDRNSLKTDEGFQKSNYFRQEKGFKTD